MRYLLLLLTLLSASFAENRDSSFTMLKANQITGLIPDIQDAYGVGFRDLNNDNHPDIYFTCFRNLNRLLINNGGIIPFVDQTILSGTGGSLMSSGNTNLELGANIADYDNDGQPDIFLAGWGKTVSLLKNEGRVSFSNATEKLNILGKIDGNQGLWFDADNDGFIDLYITDEHLGNRLYMNQQNGYFEEQAWTKQFLPNTNSQGATASDIDLDGDMDLYVSNWFAPDLLLINNGAGFFEPMKLNLPTLLDSSSSNSSSFADLDNDGDMDIIITSDEGKIYFYENASTPDEIIFYHHTDHPFYNIGDRCFGALIEDYNMDGWLDVFITTKGKNRLYLNNGKGSFFANYDSDNLQLYSTGSSAADIDRDGDLDIVVANKDANSQVYLNPTNPKKFLKFKFWGIIANRDAIGTKVRFWGVQNDSLHFLGLREVTVSASYLSSKPPEITIFTHNFSKIRVTFSFPSGTILEREYDSFGHSHFIREFRKIPKAYYTAKRNVKVWASDSTFRYNSMLALSVLALVLFYFSFGHKRYSWKPKNIALQLSLWLSSGLLFFIILGETPLSTKLITLLSLTVLAILIFTTYSEYFYKQRNKRANVRAIFGTLSDQIIEIHENDTLYETVLNTFNKHPEIEKAIYYSAESQNELTANYSGVKGEQSVTLPPLLKTKIVKNNIVELTDQKSWSKAFSGLNTLISVRKKDTLLGLIGLRINDPKNPINREDMEQFVSIANQMSISIQNNDYIKETASLIEQLTTAKIKKEYVDRLEKNNVELDEKNRELERLFYELQQKESQLIHSEKMASLGQLVAGISHELNNPISFIYSNLKILTEYIDDLKLLLNETPESDINQKMRATIQELSEIIGDSINGSKSIKEIVQNLKNFSRLDEAEWKEAKISDIVDSCLKIIKPQLKTDLVIKTNFGDDPVFLCNPGHLNQVFLNLLTNANQAVEKNGIIQIAAQQVETSLHIKVKDNGPGISKEHLAKIFDPFFTTKPVNEGTGLGLSISFSIIQKHKGTLTAQSTPEQGTTFTVTLPLNLERTKENA